MLRAAGYLIRAVAVVALAVTALAPGLATDRQAAAAAAPKSDVAFRFTDTRIDASSGLAVTAKEPDHVFTVNDHSPTRIFAVNASTGRSDATMRVSDAQNINWEAVTPGRGRNLWVGDIGDNEKSRSSITLYRFTLPQPIDTGFYPAAASFELTYPDGPHDAETLLVNPRTNDVYVVTKGPKGGALYKADGLGSGATELTKLDAKLPPMLTDGAFRPDGKQFVLRNYTTGYVYSTNGKQLGSFPLPKQEQGEGITYSADGKDFLLSSEGQRSEVLSMSVDSALATATKPPAAKQSKEPEATDEGGIGLADALFIATPIAIALLAAAAAFFLRRRKAASGAHTGSGGGRRERKYERDEPYPAPDYASVPEAMDGDGWPVPTRHGGHAAVSAAAASQPPTLPPFAQQAPPPVPPPPPGTAGHQQSALPSAPANGAPPPPPGHVAGNGTPPSPPPPPPPGHAAGNGTPPSPPPPPPPGHAAGNGTPAPPPPPGHAAGNGVSNLPPPPGTSGRRAAPPPPGGRRAGKPSGGRRRRKGEGGAEPFWLQE